MTSSAGIPDLRRTMLGDDWFRSCPEALQDALIVLGRERRLVAGEHLFLQGEAAGGLYFVLAGSLTVQTADPDGELPVLVVLEACHCFGELSLIDGRPRSHDAVADTPCTVWCVGRAPLEAWLERHPQHWRDIARLVAGKLRIAYKIVDEEIRRPMTQRVARRLWLAVLGWGWRSQAPHERLRLSQEQLARMLGTSRSSVNKALRELEDGGAIDLHYGAIEVRDAVLLRRACDGAIAVAA